MCSVWADIQRRSAGELVCKEDIRKATMTVRITSTESFGYYNHIRLTPEQRRSFRWHGYHLELRDDKFGSSCHWRGGIITRLGDTGKKTIEGFVDEILKEYKYFDGYACEELKGYRRTQTACSCPVCPTVPHRDIRAVGQAHITVTQTTKLLLECVMI